MSDGPVKAGTEVEARLDHLDPSVFGSPRAGAEDLRAIVAAVERSSRASSSLGTAVKVARDNGKTWLEIARMLGTNRGEAQRRFGWADEEDVARLLRPRVTDEVDPDGVPRQQAVRVLARNQAWQDPWTPAAATVEALEASGLEIALAPVAVWTFDLVIDRPITDDEIDALFEAGCDDCSPETGRHGTTLYFDREARSLTLAVESAFRDVESTGLEPRRGER